MYCDACNYDMQHGRKRKDPITMHLKSTYLPLSRYMTPNVTYAVTCNSKVHCLCIFTFNIAFK